MDFVDKERLSLLMKIQQRALSEISYKEVHQFSQIKLDTENFKANECWLPWLSILSGNPHAHYQHPDLFSFDYLHAYLPGEVSKNAIRKINRQPRKIKAFLIKAKMWTPVELALVDALQDYPSSIRVRVLNDIKLRKESSGRRLTDADFLRSQRVVFRWAQYFRPMIGHVKVRKQQVQWQRTLNQFEDVLSWIEREGITVHKNQTWYALVQQHDRWIARINADRLKAEAEVDALTWEEAKWEMFDTQGVEIKEITTGRALRAEGIEMEHCVFSYLDDCVNQRYRVFSLIKDSERATLGVHLDEITHQCHHDQLRGKQNSLASKALEQVASGVIQRINDEV